MLLILGPDYIQKSDALVLPLKNLKLQLLREPAVVDVERREKIQQGQRNENQVLKFMTLHSVEK